MPLECDHQKSQYNNPESLLNLNTNFRTLYSVPWCGRKTPAAPKMDFIVIKLMAEGCKLIIPQELSS